MPTENEITAIDILNKWTELSEYDPNQTSFNMLSANYEMNRLGKRLEFLNSYDPTGNLAVIYLKHEMLEFWKQAHVRCIDILEDPNCINDQLEFYNLLNSNANKKI